MRVRLRTLLLLVSPLLLLVAAAYIQWGTVGFPAPPLSPGFTPATASEPSGFHAWLRITHYVNFFFLILLIRSGLQILMASFHMASFQTIPSNYQQQLTHIQKAYPSPAH